MAKVDPEALEREANELAIKHGLIPDPDKPDTQGNRDEPPGTPPDTGQQEPPATDAPDRGDQAEAPPGFVSEERYKNAQAAMTKAQMDAAQLRRDVASLQQTVAELQSGQGSQKPAGSASEAEADVQKALDEFPEIVGPLLAKLQRLETHFETDRNQRQSEKQKDASDAHLSAIRQVHPDLDTIADDPEFHGWVSRQTPVLQQIAATGTAAEVVDLLSRYKAAVGITTEEPPQRETPIERARKVAEPTLPRGRKPDPNGSKRIWTRADIKALSLEDYEKHRDDIDQAYLEGRVR